MTKFYRILFNLAALTAVVLLAVDLFYTVVQEKLRTGHPIRVAAPSAPAAEKPLRSQLDDYRVIVERNVFGTTEKTDAPVEEEEVETLEPTSLNVVLLGTVAGDSQSAVAVIRDPAKRSQDFYREGDAVQGAVLKKILRGQVIVRVGGRDEVLKMEEPSGAKKTKGGPQLVSSETMATITVDRAEIREALGSINKLLAQVRIRPHFKDGKADGLTLNNIKKDSIFSRMGLKNGDIIQGIDGRPIIRPNDVLAFYGKLKSGSRFSLDLTRKGMSNQISYRFK